MGLVALLELSQGGTAVVDLEADAPTPAGGQEKESELVSTMPFNLGIFPSSRAPS